MAKRIYAFAVEPEMLYALRRIKQRDGISESEQIRRGIQLWLKQVERKRKRRRA